MRRVAKAVSITPMAVYRHYADLAGLLNALADEGFVQAFAFDVGFNGEPRPGGQGMLNHAAQSGGRGVALGPDQVRAGVVA